MERRTEWTSLRIGWAIERDDPDDIVVWWHNELGVVNTFDRESVTLYTEQERATFTKPISLTEGDTWYHWRWVEVFEHEVDGVLTTEPCAGKNECSDCQGVLEQMVTADFEDESTYSVEVIFATFEQAHEYVDHVKHHMPAEIAAAMGVIGISDVTENPEG